MLDRAKLDSDSFHIEILQSRNPQNSAELTPTSRPALLESQDIDLPPMTYMAMDGS